MKIKFNRFERVAGLFVVVALTAALASAVGVAIQQGWFEARVSYHTILEKGQGIFAGTRVEMAGIKVGVVDSVEITEDNSISVQFTVMEKYATRIKEDSVVRTARMFVIGDKFLDITMGSKNLPPVAHNSAIKSEVTFDLIEVFDGRSMGPHMKTLGQIMDNLKVIAEAFTDPERTQKLIRIFDRIDPLLGNANRASLALIEMSSQMTEDQHLRITLKNMSRATEEMADMFDEMPHMGKDMGEAMKTAHAMITMMNEMLPMMKELAPQLPHATRRAIEALDEAVIVLKAMQKSFLLRGSVADVKEEEAKKKSESERKPASE